MKKAVSIFLTLLVLMSSAAVISANAEVIVKTLSAFTSRTYTLSKSAKRTYQYNVKYNKSKFIDVKLKNSKTTCKLTVTAKKATKDKKPAVTVYYMNSKNKPVTVKTLKFKITPIDVTEFKNYRINVNTSRKITLKNPYAYEYKFKASKAGIVKLPSKCRKQGSRRVYNFKALKEGNVYIKVYLDGTNKYIGRFIIRSGNYKTIILPQYSSVKLRYNSHGSSVYMSESHININDIIFYKHAGAKYYASVEDESVASLVSNKVLYSTGKGKTTATVYEKLGKQRTAVGTFEVKTVIAGMAYVAKQNARLYDMMIFGNGDNTVFLDHKGKKTTALKPRIKERLLNNSLTASSFKKSEYKLYFSSTNKKVAKVSSEGKATALKAGNAKIKCAIKFKDKSVYRLTCKIIAE